MLKNLPSLRPLGCGLALLSFLAIPQISHAAPGDLDTTFGSGGKVVTDINASENQAFAVAIQQNGRVVVGGFSTSSTDLTNDFALTRYTTSGGLDSSFGSGGRVVTSLSTGNDRIAALAVQNDGKILAAGSTGNGAVNRFALVRYNSGGSLDTSFGTGGQVITNFASGSCQATAVTFVADGKILVGGFSFQGASSGKNDFALARYDSDGKLDKTFSTDGLVTTDFGATDDYLSAIAIQPDGKIVAAGTSGANAAAKFAVARYNEDGTLDTTFDKDGLNTATFPGGAATCTCMVIQGNGRIILGGYAQPSPVSFAMARFSTAGALDTSFGSGGFRTTSLSDTNSQAYAMTFQKGGKIALAGTAYVGTGYQFALARYDNAGNIDTTFGGGDGKVFTQFNSFNDGARALAVQNDGKLVAAGSTNNGGNDFAVARYASGTMDLTPQILGFNPPTAFIGDPLTITGYNFNSVNQVQLGNTLKDQPFTIIDNNRIRISAIAPGTESGKVRIFSSQGSAVSTDPFRLLPKITSFSPASGPVGTLVTINGSGFSQSNGWNITAIRFSNTGGGFIDGKNLNVQSKILATIRVPAGAITGPIRVRNAYGASQSTESFIVTAGAVKTSPSNQTF